MKKEIKSYVAISVLGLEHSIDDIFSLIEKKGEWLFLKEYGYNLEVNHKPSDLSLHYFEGNQKNKELVREISYSGLYYFWKGNAVFVSNYIYEIFDGLGNKINPASLVDEYQKYKKKKPFFYGRSSKGKKGYYVIDVGNNYKIEKANQGTVYEDLEPAIRPKSYRRSIEHVKTRISLANWKSQRKTQYK